MMFAPDIEEALSRFAEDEGLTREEALAGLIRDWLVEKAIWTIQTSDGMVPICR
jgi:hypothetical protein